MELQWREDPGEYSAHHHREGPATFIDNGVAIFEYPNAWATIEVPETDALIAPLIYSLPVQLLAYHTAVAKGTDVDQPRNLAKSVTVE